MTDRPPHTEATDGPPDASMELNVSTLGTFYEMAREGAGLAAGRLTGMTAVPNRVGVTRLNFMHGRDIRTELEGHGRRVGIQVDLSGGFAGTSMILFDAESAQRVVETLAADIDGDPVPDLAESTITEVAHIMNAGFVDGWAEVLDVAIDVSPPTYVAGSDPETFLSGIETVPSGDDLALLFQSKIATVGERIGFEHYLYPDRETVASLLDGHAGTAGGAGIGYDKLIGFDRMAEKGAAEVATNLTKLTGVDMDVEIRRINFLSLDTVPEEVPDEELISVAFRFTGTPSGFLVFVFDLESARTLVEATLPAAGPELDAMARDALQEFGNVMASGFIDGWANVLDTTIEHTPPEYTRDLGGAVIDPLIIGLSRRQEFAFVFDTTITADDREVDVDVYAIPDEEDLERALSELDPDRVEEAAVTAEFDVAAVERDDSVTPLEVDR